ncbi:hypothetical protein EDD85DRAFT_874920 [Armillaria nabsnona]|nr:hypothetical protein EDD85DRAFT_874920 [Armillaria nabsnona]
MDNCPKCEFGAIDCYTPSVNATELLQSGFSSLDVCQASILNDIEYLERELQRVDPLFLQIRDRRDKLLKDLGGCKALLAPIRRLSRETLLQIFDLASSESPSRDDAPWCLGKVCSTWRSISRSCPSLWTRIHISKSYKHCLTFLEKYASLSRDLPMHLSINRYLGGERFRGLLLHSERLKSLDLSMSREELSDLLSLTSSAALRLTKISISLYGVDEPEINQAVLTNIFSSSPLTEAYLQHIPYSSMPINTTKLRKYHVYSYDPAELLTMLHQAHHLTEFVVTMAPAPRRFISNIPPVTYAHTHYRTSLQRLSFVVTLQNTRGRSKIPLIFNSVSLPALQQFDILAQEDQPLFGIQLATFEPHEYSHIVDLFRRSECNLTIVTLAVPVSVQAFLVPILAQSPALQKLDICVNASIAGDAFKVLTLEQGTAQHLKELRIKEDPLRTAISGILEEADGLHLMVTSRSYGDSCLETLVLSLTSAWGDWRLASPVAKDSPLRDLFRMKEKGLHIELLLDRRDCLVDGEARVDFFGPN